MTRPADDPLYGNPASDLLRGALAMDAEAASTPASMGHGEWHPPTAEHLAEMLPAYRVLCLLGRGGMGAVYQGVQLSLNRPVAIKLLPAKLAASAEFVSRFQREAQTLARLQHPGIVAVYDFGRTEEGELYFIMEFVDGTDLQRVIHGPGLEPEQALNLTLQVCEALQFAHSQGVVHRDIKPANVLITQDGRAKLADFGLARPLTASSGMTAASMVMGTPEYMAPEQWAGKVDHRADIYALGVMLYEMLTGTRPHGAFDLPSEKSHVDARLDEVVVKAMRQAPEQRYQNVSELRDAVQRIRTTQPPQARAESMQRTGTALAAPQHETRRPSATARPARRSGGWEWAALALIVSVLGIGAWAMLSRHPLPENDDKAVAAQDEQVVPKEADAPKQQETPAEPPAEKPVPMTATVIKPEPAEPKPPAQVAPEPPSARPAAAAAPPVFPPQAAPPTVMEIFSRECQNLIGWALSPLEEEVPSEVRQNLTFIREDLIDEGKTQPAASIDAYRAGFYLCEDLLNALNERDRARVASGYRAAQSAANQLMSNQALDARRNYKMSWPQYAREESQRSAFQQQNQARTAVAGEATKVSWAAQSARLRSGLDARYRAFRAALRE